MLIMSFFDVIHSRGDLCYYLCIYAFDDPFICFTDSDPASVFVLADDFFC